MFDTVCSALRVDGIIENNEVFCSQAPNNDNGTYCECLQAELCVDDSERDVYIYKDGQSIVDPYSYSVSYLLHGYFRGKTLNLYKIFFV